MKVLIFTCLCLAITVAQTRPTPAAKPIPRDAAGHPDLSGIWQSGGVSLFGETGQSVPDAAGRGLQAPVREPAPYKPEAAAKVKELASDNRNDPAVRCRLPGVTRLTTYPMPLEIVQTPKKTIILYEAMHAFRIIPTDGRPHPGDLDPTYMGDSVGKWEGDTFVVDAIGFNDQTWLSGPGTFHSEALHVTERYTRNPDDTLHYEAVATDPEVFTKPWKVVNATLRHPPRDERIMEYECIDQDFQHLGPK